jgi:hypothetical protein
MDRKEFLKLGACCGAALVLKKATLAAEDAACAKRIEFARGFVVDVLSEMDERLPRQTRERVMEANGRACYVAGHGEPKVPQTPADVDEWLVGLQKHVGRENAWREGERIHFKYVANPRGLRVDDGYCLCPLMEDGPKSLSPTYCHCSVGYVSQIFQSLGRRCRVDLVESLRTGGRECHFVATLG